MSLFPGDRWTSSILTGNYFPNFSLSSFCLLTASASCLPGTRHLRLARVPLLGTPPALGAHPLAAYSSAGRETQHELDAFPRLSMGKQNLLVLPGNHFSRLPITQAWLARLFRLELTMA